MKTAKSASMMLGYCDARGIAVAENEACSCCGRNKRCWSLLARGNSINHEFRGTHVYLFPQACSSLEHR